MLGSVEMEYQRGARAFPEVIEYCCHRGKSEIPDERSYEDSGRHNSLSGSKVAQIIWAPDGKALMLSVCLIHLLHASPRYGVFQPKVESPRSFPN